MRRSAFVWSAAAFSAVPWAASAARPAVTVAYAGSLVTLMERSIGPAFAATGYRYAGEGKGSVAIANVIREGLRVPDVFISADPAVIENLRGAAGNDAVRWYASFASTRMVIGYSPRSPHAAELARIAAGKRPWFDALSIPGVRVARTDPALDPKGYRVLQTMQLAKRTLGAGDVILPEQDALTRLDTGEIDAVWLYSVEAVSRALPAIELPPQINLGDPKFAAEYALAVVTVGTAKRIGAPILYALTVPSAAANPAGGAAFIAFLLGPNGRALSAKAGLAPQKPTIAGDRAAVPSVLTAVLPA